MNIRESAQDYLETILILLNKNGKVKSIDIANQMGITKQSVHRAVKNLKQEEYIFVDNKGYITFCEKGEKIAVETYDKHQVLAKFFISLGVSSDIAYADACKIEHYISRESFSALKEMVLKNEKQNKM